MDQLEAAETLKAILEGNGLPLEDVGEPEERNGLVGLPVKIEGYSFFLTIDEGEE